MSKNYSAGILTLGCKVNQYESEAIAERLRARGFEVVTLGTGAERSVCGGYLVNTCTVTAEADRKSRQMIRRLHALNPAAPIVVTGCTAQTSPDALAKIEGVAAVIGNAEKLRAADLLADLVTGLSPALPAPLVDVPPLEAVRFEPMCLASFPRTRVYIKIEDGCENRCAYCAIPGARGPVRSKSPDDVLTEVRGFCAAGCPEIVLTGIETASYGRDFGERSAEALADLLTRVDAVCGPCRIRLGSIDPSLFRQPFVDAIAPLSSLAPHFHISLQSGCSRTLAAMRRKYNADQARAAMERLRAALPDVQFTTDVIVGFPGETDEDFAETEAFMREAGFLRAHIFPYSRRRGTPADRMPGQVPEEVKRARAAALARIDRESRRAILSAAVERAEPLTVLFESFDGTFATGHTPNFMEIKVPSPVSLHGQTRAVRPCSTDGETVTGVLIR